MYPFNLCVSRCCRPRSGTLRERAQLRCYDRRYTRLIYSNDGSLVFHMVFTLPVRGSDSEPPPGKIYIILSQSRPNESDCVYLMNNDLIEACSVSRTL